MSAIVDVVIVLSAIYVALSCFVSWVNESIQSGLRQRGRYLYLGILNLLCGHEALANAILRSPFVAAGTNDTRRIANPANSDDPKYRSGLRALIPWIRTYRPSYVDPHAFSTALWQAIRSLDTTDTNSTALLFSTPVELMAELRNQVTAVRTSNAPLATSLAALLNQAQNDSDKLLLLTEGWFNAQMDRVSGWYRRYTQWFVAAIAFLAVSFLGVDSVQIATVAFSKPNVTARIVDPIVSAVTQSTANNAAAQDAVGATVYKALQGVYILGGHFSWNPWTNWHYHWPGMLITLAALILGAPFWFDLLLALVNVRLAGKKPELQTPKPVSG